MLNDDAPPKKTSLLKSTLFAFFLALILIWLIVLPAEYGIDPTGFGKLTGLNKLTAAHQNSHEETISNSSQITQQAKDNAPFPMGKANTHNSPPTTSNFEIVLKPADEVEYKALLPVGESIFYQWSVKNGDLTYVDFHGDPTEGQFPEGYAQSYATGEMSASTGSFTATFTGHHGWYWLNISENEIIINLKVTGYFESLEEIYRGNQMAPH